MRFKQYISCCSLFISSILRLFVAISSFPHYASASPPPMRSQFPPDFFFGAAISAYQTEGAATEDGRGQSIWDVYTYQHPGTSNGDVAADSYHLYKKDIQLLKDMGMNAYRISISWPRILPTGKLSGGVNQKGIIFYSNMINEMLAQGVTPFVTLFHWDLPQPLEEEYGGFLSSRIVVDYRDYADVCFKEFGDRVKHWITLNEPHSLANGGYSEGTFAPGRCSSTNGRQCDSGDSATEPYIVGHNQLLAHAAAVQLYRQKYQTSQKGMIGITLNSMWFIPAIPKNTLDVAAVTTALDFILGWMLNPIMRGEYPKSMRKVGERLPKFTPNQVQVLKGSIDFLGVNYYTSRFAGHIPDANKFPPDFKLDSGVAQTTRNNNNVSIGKPTPADWLRSYPEGFTELLLYIKDNYDNPLMFITENGVADDGKYVQTSQRATLRDPVRVDYLSTHLSHLNMAMKRGANVKGYFTWSLLDNFEWGDGYKMRYGLHYVDFNNSCARIPKKSTLWFKKFMRT
ncbi:Beta-glucosidase 24 [Linum grandiflorum]